jgi:hypothetical protein
VLPVVNRAPRHPRARAEIATALTRLTGAAGASAAPLWIPERRVDDALRNGSPLPHQVVAPLAGAVQAVLDRAVPPPTAGAPTRIAPGSLGTGSDRP